MIRTSGGNSNCVLFAYYRGSRFMNPQFCDSLGSNQHLSFLINKREIENRFLDWENRCLQTSKEAFWASTWCKAIPSVRILAYDVSGSQFSLREAKLPRRHRKQKVSLLPSIMAELLLDPAIRLWVILPIVIITFLVGIIRHYLSMLLQSKKELDLSQVSDRWVFLTKAL